MGYPAQKVAARIKWNDIEELWEIGPQPMSDRHAWMNEWMNEWIHILLIRESLDFLYTQQSYSMSIYLYVCVIYVFIFICVYIHTHTHIHTYVCVLESLITLALRNLKDHSLSSNSIPSTLHRGKLRSGFIYWLIWTRPSLCTGGELFWGITGKIFLFKNIPFIQLPQSLKFPH